MFFLSTVTYLFIYNHNKIIYLFIFYTDGKLYDAFISFRSSKNDEFWVLNTLFPMLENEMGFKICVHFRDFLVGESKYIHIYLKISLNIIDILCLHIFFWILSNSRITFIVFGGN